MNNHHDRLIIITGGPGAGKTTLIDRLRAAGFATSPETGRALIKDQVAIGGAALPWLDQWLFAEVSLTWEIRAYRAALARPGPVFFDHALPGMVGYWRLAGRPVPAHVTAAVRRFRFRRRVFVAPPWREIYINDAERKQTWEEAVRLHAGVVDAYRSTGYELVELPRTTVDERLRFVLRHTGLAAR